MNPSRYSRRFLIAAIAFIPFLFALYMGLYQLGVFTTVWDPFFDTAKVLNSNLSHQMRHLLHMPDALLGAFAYLGEIVFAFLGSSQRYKTMPWLVILYGLNIAGVSLVSILLVILQGTVVGAWCILCLLSATLSIVLIALAWEEVKSVTRRSERPNGR